jgi:hypothetical protein
MKSNFFNIKRGILVFNLLLGFFIVDNGVHAANSNVFSCYCKETLDATVHAPIVSVPTASDCEQACANRTDKFNKYFAFTAEGAYQAVNKAAGGSSNIAKHTCSCSSTAPYSNAITGTFAVSNEEGCLTQCRGSSSKVYQYDTNAWKDVPAVATNAPASTRFNYTLLESFPGFFTRDTQMTDFPAMIIAIYKFGIWTVGIAGFFMLVVGGFMYMASAGNTSTAGSARGIIWDALLGIVAALGAYLILYVINPDLTKVTIGSSFVAVSVKYDSVDASNPSGSTSCQDCISVIDICKESPCSLNKDLAAKLRKALSGQNARITEGWPATTNHSSSCHGNGTCADVNLISNKGNVQDVKKLYDALKSAGLSPLYEDTADGCIKYTAVGVYCKPYPTMTAPSFHVNNR